MIVAIEKFASATIVNEELRRRGIDAVKVQFARQTVFVLAAAKIPPADKQALGKIAGVERVMDAPEPYQLVHRSLRPEGTSVDLGGGVMIGRGRFAVIADLVDEVEPDALPLLAQSFAHGRAAALVVGLPEGDGSESLKRRRAAIEALEEFRSATGLRIGIEAVTDGDLDDLVLIADLVRVPGERMQDYPFLRRVGAAGKPVILVRALSATLEEWLLAAEYLAATGNDQVILCERGIRTFTPETGRVTLDLAAVARLGEMTHLPVVVDPLRSSGSLSLGARLARAAVAVGADGLVLPVSAHARAQGPVLRAESLEGLLASLGATLAAEGKSTQGAARVAVHA